MYPASAEYLNRQRVIPNVRQWTLGATVDLGFAVCDWFGFDFYVYLSVVFSACYHWWICFLVRLLSSFFLFFKLLLYFLILNNNFLFFILITLFYSFFSFFSPFSYELCGWQGLGAPAGCQAWASEVGEPRSGHWSTRDLPAPRNIIWQKLSQRSPSQH